MPQIPEMSAPRASMNVPAAAQMDVNAAGAPDRALAQAAGQVSDMALQLEAKRKKAADNDYAFKNFTDDYQAIEQKSMELKASVGEDASGYSEGMNKFIADRQQKAIDAAPNDDALHLYRDKVGTLFKGASMDALHYENSQKAQYYVKSLDENANALASTQLANPDPFKAKYLQQQMENNLDENAQTHFVDAGTREKLKQKMRDQISVSTYDGLEAKERYGDQIKLLKNTDPDTDIFAGMDAKTRGSLLNRAVNGLQTQARQADADLKGRVADVMDAQMKGEDVDSDVLLGLAHRVANSGLRPDEKDRLGDSLRVGGIVSEQKKLLVNTPMSQWGDPKEILKVPEDGTNSRVITKAQAVLSREMVSLRNEAKDDPAAYAIKSSPGLKQMGGMIQPGDPDDTQNFDAKLLSQQQALGIPQALMTKMQAQQLVQNFKNQSPEEAAKSAVALKMAHGKNSALIFSQIAKEGGAPSDLMLMAFMPNAQSTAAVMDNIKRGPDIKTAFENQFEIKDDHVRKEVGSQMNKYATALHTEGTGVLSLSNALENQVGVEARKRMLQGADSSMSSAVSNSIKTIVDTNFVPVKSANSNFLMPRYDGNGTMIKDDTVAAFVKAHSTREGFKALDVAIPDAIQKDFDARPKSNDLGKFMAPDETGQDRFYKMLERQGYWTPSADNSELILSMRQNGKARAIKDSQGNDIRKSFHDISSTTDDLTLTAQMPWYQRAFHSNKAEAKQ